MDQLSQVLINEYQKGFPVSSRPFLEIAKRLNIPEKVVIERMEALLQSGVITRVGPVFNHKKAGASTLAAMSVPASEEAKIADIINQFSCVNHNYAREHDFNLWFVLTACCENQLQKYASDIEQACQYPILLLPMEQAYHIDLGFQVDWSEAREKHYAYA